jgi:hypothetical protein
MEQMLLSEYLVLGIFILTGLLSLVSSIFNFDWLFASRKAAPVVGTFGRTGARIFYGLLGLALTAAGIAFFH